MLECIFIIVYSSSGQAYNDTREHTSTIHVKIRYRHHWPMLNTLSCNFDDTLYITTDTVVCLVQMCSLKRILSQCYSCSFLYKSTRLRQFETRTKNCSTTFTIHTTNVRALTTAYLLYFPLSTVNGLCESL